MHQKHLCHYYCCYQFFVFHDKKKEILKNNFFYLNVLFIVAWLLKSLLVSGCLIYPMGNLSGKLVSDEGKTIQKQSPGEAFPNKRLG